MENVLRVSEALYRAVKREAGVRRRSPDELAEELLARELLPQHPHVELLTSRSGPRAVVRGTRVGVYVIVGYSRAGMTPEQICAEALPHLTLAEVHDALSYAYDHAEAIEEALRENSVEAWQDRLRDRLGAQEYARLTGEPRDA